MGNSEGDDPPDRAVGSSGSVSGSAAAADGETERAVGVTDRSDGCVGLDGERLRQLTLAVLDDLDVPIGMAVDVVIVDVEEMAELNASHMDGEGPTDVLAFPLDEPGEGLPGVPQILGDVVLCPEIATAQAAEADKRPSDELDMLLVHGLLHLLGYDHQEADERREMFGLTDRLLEAHGGRR